AKRNKFLFRSSFLGVFMFRILIVLLGLAGLLTTFQNCQPARISSSSSDTAVVDKADLQLTPVVAYDPEDANGSISQTSGAGESSLNHFACILEGPGKSIKLGSSGGQHQIPQVLCMSQEACLEIASQAFEVKGPEFRGYCKPQGNPHVAHVTNEDLQ